MTPVDDLTLVKRVQKGDQQAFNLLVVRHQNKIAGLISRTIHNPADVADIAQNTFIKAYRSLKNFRAESAFSTWLYRIAVNATKDFLSAQNKQKVVSGVDVHDADGFESHINLTESATPERQLLTQEIKAVITQTIEQLPTELATAITLREFENLSYDEIATIMEVPVGTVRSRIFRAREAIDSQLAPLLNEA